MQYLFKTQHFCSQTSFCDIPATMVIRVILQVACVVLCILISDVWGLRLGAFNAHRFGPAKALKEDVMEVLARIAARYDILLVQEITDSSGKAIKKLLQRIKQDHGITMSMDISDRLGRTSNKEQYAFLYRKDRGISVVDAYHFDDGDEASQNDLFQREPYIVRFYASECKVKDFTLVGLHTMPSKTVEELQALTQVVQQVRNRWRTDSIMILGDLNADCRYMPKKDWPSIQLKQNTDFWWAIGDGVDTTVNTNTDCAYDRFIIYGRRLKDAVTAQSAQVFDFQEHFGLSTDQALAVSDHYPIELTLGDQQQHRDRDASSQASGAWSLMEALQQAWHAAVKRVSNWRIKYDL